MLNLRKMPSRTNVFATPTSLSLVSPPVYYPEAVHFQQNGLSLESLLAGQINPPEQQQWGGGVVHFSIPSQSHTHATTLESRWCALRPSVAQLVFFGEEQDAHRQTTAAALFPFRGRQEEDTSTTRNLSAASQPVQVQTHDECAPHNENRENLWHFQRKSNWDPASKTPAEPKRSASGMPNQREISVEAET